MSSQQHAYHSFFGTSWFDSVSVNERLRRPVAESRRRAKSGNVTADADASNDGNTTYFSTDDTPMYADIYSSSRVLLEMPYNNFLRKINSIWLNNSDDNVLVLNVSSLKVISVAYSNIVLSKKAANDKGLC